MTTTEEAFTHISRVQMENCIPDENGLIPAQMDPFETYGLCKYQRVMHDYLDKSKIQIFLRGKNINKPVFLHLIDNFILYEKKYLI